MTTPRATPGAALAFGHRMLAEWQLDPEFLYLNHGTVGCTPRRVLARQQAIRDEIESAPSRYMLRELTSIRVGGPRTEMPRMRRAAAEVAAFVGARAEDLVFVDNATTGVSAVLRSLELAPGDEIVMNDLAYGAVTSAARFVTREAGASLVTVAAPYPMPGGPAAFVEGLIGALTPRTKMLLVDHITSETALLLPVAEITRRAHEKGVPVFVDGAHVPGSIPLDIPALGADWYTGNLHKWGWAPRSSGILWAPPERQAGLHPAVISWGLDQGFTAEFDLIGTRDPSPFLAAPEGIAMMRDLGLEAVMHWNHTLAWDAARLLCEAFETPLPIPETMVATMATIPLPERLGSDATDAAELRDALLFEDRIEAQVHAKIGRLWMRVSAQVYNELPDYERFAEAVLVRARKR